MSRESPEKEPQLPEGTTAEQLLNEYSEKALAKMAHSQGFSPVAFSRYLNAQARRERVAASVTQAEEVLQKAKSEPSERIESDVIAEQAVIRGMKEIVRRFGPEDLTDEEIEVLEREAYAAVEEVGTMPLGHAHTIKRKKIEKMFERIVDARTQNEIATYIDRGVTEANARRMAVASLHDQTNRTNLIELSSALRHASIKFGSDYEAWSGRQTRKMTELQSIIDGYGKRSLTDQESEVLSAFTKAAKAHYFNPNSRTDSKILHKYRRVLGTVFSAYRNHGPHKRTAENVAGPTEAFTSHQSEREAGYRRTGKARPHRDPSGGSGENW